MIKTEASKDVLRLKQLIDSAVEVMPRLSGREQDAQAASIFIGSRNHSIPEALILDTSLSLEERALYQIMLIKTLRTGSSAAILYSSDLIHVAAVSSPKTLRRYQYALRLTRWITRAAQARDRGIVWAISDEPLSLADTLVLDPYYLDFVNSLLNGTDRRLRVLAEGVAHSINGDLMQGRHPFATAGKLDRAAAELDRQSDQTLAMQHRVYAVDTSLHQAHAANANSEPPLSEIRSISTKTTNLASADKQPGDQTGKNDSSRGLGKFYLTPVSLKTDVEMGNPQKISTYPQPSRQTIPVGGKFYPTPRSSSLLINTKNKTTTKDSNSLAAKFSSPDEPAVINFQTAWLKNFATQEKHLAEQRQANQQPTACSPVLHRLQIDLAQFPGAASKPAAPSPDLRKPLPREPELELTPVCELKKLAWPSGLTESETAGFLRILKTHPLPEAAHLLEYYTARQRKVSEGLKPLGNKVAWLHQISNRMKSGEFLANNWVKEAGAQTSVVPTVSTQAPLHQPQAAPSRVSTPSESMPSSAAASTGRTPAPVRSTTSLKRAMDSLNATRSMLNPAN